MRKPEPKPRTPVPPQPKPQPPAPTGITAEQKDRLQKDVYILDG